MRRRRAHLVVLLALAAAVLSGLQDDLQDALTNIRFRANPRAASGDIVLVAIDPRSIDELGVWPWPRSVHAQLIRRLEDAQVRQIAFDVDFSSRSDAASDAAFLDALKAADGSVVLPVFQQSSGGEGLHVTRPLPQFAAEAWLGAVNVRAERGGLVRRYAPSAQMGREQVPSIAAVLAGRHEMEREPFLVDFGIEPNSVPMMSYIDVLRGGPEVTSRLAGKSVIVGATAVELGDRFNVPLHGVIAGPLLQSLAAESMRQNRDLRSAPSTVTIAGLLGLMLIMTWTWSRVSGVVRAILLACLALGAEAGAALVHGKLPLVIDTSLFHVAIAAYLAAVLFEEINVRGLLRRIAESRFARLATLVGDGLVCADADGLIRVWNRSAAGIFGYEADEMLGRPLDALWHQRPHGGFSVASLSQDLLQRPGGQTMEIDGRTKDGRVVTLEVCFTTWDSPDGVQLGAVIRDISARKREELRIRYLAEHDTPTGLINRDTLHGRAAHRITTPAVASHDLALMVIGIDDFHRLNDMLGHACGDEVLKAVAERLRDLIAKAGTVARLSGNEFAVLLEGVEPVANAADLAARVAAAFADAPIETPGRRHRLPLKVGIALYPRDCGSAEELFGCAHLALERAKSSQERTIVFFDRAIRDAVQERLTLEAELAPALERGEFEMFYQPQICLGDGRLVGVEALIRWRHPERGLVSPAEFMPVVNASAISDKVALWVLDTGCAQAAAWERDGRRIRVGVNLSPSLIRSGSLVSAVRSALLGTGLSPSLLELEVTEDILLTNSEATLQAFQQVQALGVRIVFDDFGTGYASLSYLRKFPLDGLKIDRSFVSGLKGSSEDAAIVGCTVTLAKLLGMSVIAEGIEDAATACLLKNTGCHEGQGYLYGKPMPASDLARRFTPDGTPAPLQNGESAAA